MRLLGTRLGVLFGELGESFGHTGSSVRDDRAVAIGLES